LLVLMQLPLTASVSASEAPSSSAPTPTNKASMYTALRRDDPSTAYTEAAKLAEAGDAEAQFVLGLLLDTGAGVRFDHPSARRWLEKSAAAFPPAAQYLAWRFASGFGEERGVESAAQRWADAPSSEPELDPAVSRWLEFREGRLKPKFPRALLWMMNHASDGDVVAEANLAMAYLETHWTTPNAAEHLHWLKEAALHKDAESAARLASYYEYGLMVTKDPAKALEYLRVAAEAGIAAAQFKLGEQYRTGDGVAIDRDAALNWLRRAAAQDHVEALEKLSEMLRKPESGPADYPESLRLARRAAELGSAEAMAEVADMIRLGQGAPRDYAAAAKHFEEAAEKGYAYAADMRAWMQQQGELGPIDNADAQRWYEKAAAGRNEHAMQQLGLIYRDGKGVPKDPAKAFEWFERGAREGNAWCQNEVGWMLRQGIGVEADDEEAVNWFKLAAKNGEPRADENLAFHLLTGRGVSKDVPEALRHISIAARDLRDSWLMTSFHQACAHATIEDKPALQRILRECLDDPKLLNCAGSLPEICLSVLEIVEGFADPKAAETLLVAMRDTRRPQSRLQVGWHSYIGQNLPFDLELARKFVRDAAEFDPRASATMLATIDSIAGETPETRAEATKKLHEFADAGDRAAAMTLSTRLSAGIGEERDAALAQQYLNRAMGTPAGVDLEKVHAANPTLLSPKPPSETELAARMEAIKAQRGNATKAPPFPVKLSPPAYPYELRVAGREGTAEIEFTVNLDGTTSDIKCVKSSHPLFAAYAVTAVKRWRFAPALEDGKPVSQKMIQPLTFSLNEPDAALPRLPSS
jgi:TonB family protein